MERHYKVNGKMFSGTEWVDSELLKGYSGGPFSVFCNRHGDVACMHFVKGYKNIHNFYCAADIFSDNAETGGIIEMRDGEGKVLHVVPTGYHHYGNLFLIPDLRSSGVCLDELRRIQES